MRVAALALVLATGSLGSAQQPEKNAPAKPFPDDVVKAWTDAGAEVVWARADADGTMQFTTKPRTGAVPAFRFRSRGTGALAKLPVPGVPFGLELRDNNVSDESLKELAHLTSLTALDLNCEQITDAGVKHLAPLKNLIALDLDGTQVTDAGVKHLAALRNLTSLRLTFVRMTDAGVKELAALPKLRTLSIGGSCYGESELTDGSVKELAAHNTNLTALDLSWTKVTDAGVKELTPLTKLTRLDLHGTAVTDAGLKALAPLTKLTTLDLRCPGVTDAGLKDLAPLKGITTLYRTHWKITDQTLKALREIGLLHALDEAKAADGQRPTRPEDVVTLHLKDTAVTDAGLKELARFKNLSILDLSGTKVTGAGLKDLVVLKGLTALNLYQAPVTNAGLNELAALTSLTYLNVLRTNAAPGAVAQLQKGLPKCHISGP